MTASVLLWHLKSAVIFLSEDVGCNDVLIRVPMTFVAEFTLLTPGCVVGVIFHPSAVVTPSFGILREMISFLNDTT